MELSLLAVGIVASIITGVLSAGRLVKPTNFARARKKLVKGPRELVDGAVVTLLGTVRAEAKLVSPVFQRDCVAWYARAQCGDRWATRSAMVDFVLETDFGDVLIDRFGEPQVATKIERRRLHGYAANVALTAMTAAPYGTGAFEERIVVVGQKVMVYGVVATEVAPPDQRELGFREGVTRYRLHGEPKVPLALGDP